MKSAVTLPAYHTFISNLARSGVHPRMAQALARHSRIDLTMNVYTHTVIRDLDSAVESLPAIAGRSRETGARVRDEGHGLR